MNFYDIAVKVLRFLVYLINGKPIVTGTEHIPQDQPFIMASTHRSLLDPVFLAVIFGNQGERIAFMAKQQLFEFKPLGYLLKKGMVFPVDREQASTSTIRHAVKVMNEEGHNLGIFPSGTRYSTEIKGGTAFIQRLSKRAILPVTIQPPIGFWQIITRQKAKIAIGPPIEVDPEVNYDKAHMAQVDQELANCFDRLDQQLDPTYHYLPPVKKS